MGSSGNNVDEATRGVDLEQGVTERKLLTNKKSKSMIVGNRYLRECMAEILGSFVLVLFGDGVAAQVVLSDNEAGSYLSMNLGWGIGIIFGIHAAGGISGAHLNPAVSTTMALFRRMPAWKVPGYIVSQVIGAFMAALLLWAVYSPLLVEMDPDAETTMGIFCTFPYKNTPNMNCFLNEVVGSALLLGLIFALADEYNKPASPHSFPTAVGVLIGGIGMAFGVESGYAINPARDFGPRMAASFRYGSQVWTMNDCYFWVPLVAPIVGGAVGAGLYQLFVGIHHYSDEEAE